MQNLNLRVRNPVVAAADLCVVALGHRYLEATFVRPLCDLVRLLYKLSTVSFDCAADNH